jgi:hypothetical protein
MLDLIGLNQSSNPEYDPLTLYIYGTARIYSLK